MSGAGGGAPTVRRWSGPALAFLELLAACGFVVAQPLYSVFGRSPDEFIYRDASTFQIVGFALVVCFVPTLVLWSVEMLVGVVSRRAAVVLHLLFIGVLATLFTLQLLKKTTSLGAAALVVLAVACGIGAACVLARVQTARLWLRFASPAPVVLMLLFLFGSSISPLVMPTDVAAAQLGDADDAPSIVMVNFDEWPTSSIVGGDGRIDRSLYPNLAKLADQSTWYRNETSVSSVTFYAIPTILTGRYPHNGDIPDASTHPQNLFTFLGGSYRLAVSEIVTRLCPCSLCPADPAAASSRTGLGGLLDKAGSAYRSMVSPNPSTADPTAGFEERDAGQVVSIARGATDKATFNTDLAAQNRPERFVNFLDTIHENEKPTLHYLHILLPHVPYRYLPDGRQYPFPDSDFGRVNDRWIDAQWPPALAYERMLLQTGYVDRLVGELLDRLHRTKMYDRSVVVVTADHGNAFTAGETVRGMEPNPTVPSSLYPRLVWAPLIIKASGQTRGEISDANVMTVDIMPTLAKLVGFKIPWKVDGVVAGTRASPEKVYSKTPVVGLGLTLSPPDRFDGRPGLQAMLAGNVDAVTQPGDPATQPFRVLPEGEIVDRPVSDFTVRDRAPDVASLEQLDALHHVDLSGGTVPALVWGSFGRAATIAVAVNGTIGGVSPTFPDGDTPNRFAAMVPDRLLRNGRNDVRLYLVDGTGDATTLTPIDVRQG